jgi:hypothetical protein
MHLYSAAVVLGDEWRGKPRSAGGRSKQKIIYERR